jgi:pyridoxine 5-phosphate synthase
MLLGVNIDHVATLRNARGENDPSVLAAALICEISGADGITVHLREDRRHIKDEDLFVLKDQLRIPLNLEMAVREDILEKALDVRPRMCTIVPENREEITTEGGLDLYGNIDAIKEYTQRLQKAGILVSLFIEADMGLENALRSIRPDFIEIHTGEYSRTYYDEKKRKSHLDIFRHFTGMCISNNIRVNAGHGLNYNNVREILTIEQIEELNIGHSIIARSVFSGLQEAVREMKRMTGD